MSLKEFVKELNGNRVEGELMKSVFYSLIASLLLLAILYYVKFRFMENFFPRYGFYLFFALISYSIMAPSIRQVRAYKNFACMSGMMIGMTIGMIAGFLPGFLIGATNGMFVGSIFGMFVGVSLGIWNGKCCGIMGIMEGIMAGFMGGLMGAMTSVMLLTDHLMIITPFIFVILATILFGLNYMIFKEAKHLEREIVEDHFFTTLLSFVLIALTSLIMIIGPRSALFGG